MYQTISPPLALNPVQQPDDDEQHHDGEDNGHVAEPGRVGGDEGSGGIEGERDGKAADGDALGKEQLSAPQAESRTLRRRLNPETAMSTVMTEAAA